MKLFYVIFVSATVGEWIWIEFRPLLFLTFFFLSARPCSHLNCVLRLLLDFNDKNVEAMMVSRFGGSLPLNNVCRE